MRILSILFLSLSLLSCTTESSSISDEERAAQELLSRLLPKHQDSFVFKEMESDSITDYFEIESKSEKIYIGGNSAGSMASGLYWYLKNYCNAQVSLNSNQLNLPDRLPQVTEKIRVETPFEYRYIFNYCTYGYSMPWWNWERWESMITIWLYRE